MPALMDNLQRLGRALMLPIAVLPAAGLLLLVNPSVPPKTVKEFVEWTRTFKGPLNFGSAGTGSLLHLAAELFRTGSRLDMVHVPYKGAAGQLVDVTAGNVQLTFVSYAAARGFIRDGKVRALGVTSAKRAASRASSPNARTSRASASGSCIAEKCPTR